MTISWENVILSWVNVCAVCSDHINTSEDLSDGKLLECFVPSCTKYAGDNYHQKTIKFIQREYPLFWSQIPSELQKEDTLIIYSLLIHYYSFIDDPVMRNKMCSLSNGSQIQIKRFLEFLLNKDITKDAVTMAIKSCCESPVQSLIKFFENFLNESKTPLEDFLKVKSLKPQLSTRKTESKIFQETSMQMLPKMSTEVKEHNIMEQESRTSAAFTIADNNIDKDCSLEWDYTDVFEDFCPPVICGSTTVDTLPEETENKNDALFKEFNLLCLERDSLLKEIEEKDLILNDIKTKMTQSSKEIILKTEEILLREKEVEQLTNFVQRMDGENLEMSKKVNLLQDELNLVSECSSNEMLQKTLAENEELKDIIAGKDELLCEKDNEIKKQVEYVNSFSRDLQKRDKNIIDLFEKAEALKTEFKELKVTTIRSLADIISPLEAMAYENDILRRNNFLLEQKLIKTEELVTELNSKILSLEEDLIEKKKVIDNLMNMHLDENVSLQTKISDEQVKVAEVLQKYTNLKLRYIEKAAECTNMKVLYEEKWSNLKEQFPAALKEEKEKIITQHKTTVLDLENSLEFYKKKFTMCHEDTINLRKQVWDLHEKLLKQNEIKAKLERQLSLLNRNKAKCEVIGERISFSSEQQSVKYLFASRKQLPSVSTSAELQTCGETRTTIRREQIYSTTNQLPLQSEGANEFNARLEDLEACSCAAGQSEENMLTEYQRRNSMVLPHLKSSYAVTNGTKLRTVTENEIKFGSSGCPQGRRDTF